MTQPKVTLAQWKERVKLNAVGNTNTGSSEPGTNSGDTSTATTNSRQGIADTKGSGNPLHPDVTEELTRLRETVQILKRQVYGSSAGDMGMAKHISEIEERLDSHTGSIVGIINRLGKLEGQFTQLIDMLGIEEEGNAGVQ